MLESAHETFLRRAKLRGQIPTPEESAVAAILSEHAPAMLQLALTDLSVLQGSIDRSLQRVDDRDEIRQLFSGLAQIGPREEFFAKLRKVRHEALIRVALREIEGHADVAQTASEISCIAASAIDVALQWVAASDRRAAELCVLGMGKLSGEELNFGSDVDLIFLAPDSHHDRESENEEAARIVSQAIGEVTSDGFVFRVDLRLRPDGSRGPLVNTMTNAERYYETKARPWERAVLLRSAPMAGDAPLGEAFLKHVSPFVFPRRVDPSIANEMRSMVRRSRQEARGDASRDIKLGQGGIREAEFAVQTLQLVWGGVEPGLRVPGTLSALAKLRTAGFVTPREADALTDAWSMLRRVEHRLHMQKGYQTHTLPENPSALSSSLGYASVDDFERALSQARQTVREIFDSLRPDSEETGVSPSEPLVDAIEQASSARELVELSDRLEAFGDDHSEIAAYLYRLSQGHSPFSREGRGDHRGLAEKMLDEIREGAFSPSLALRHLGLFFRRGGAGYAGALQGEPRLLRRLVGLFGSSEPLSKALLAHPESMAEVLLGESPSREWIEARHQAAHALIPVDGDPREELIKELRRARRESILRIGLGSVDSELSPRDVQRALTALAEEQVRIAMNAALRGLDPEVRDAVCVVALGKLGGAEMGFGSDLDLLFLLDDDARLSPSQIERATTAVTRGIRLLTTLHPEGPGYEVDTRLRPQGSAGVLVVSLDSFARYHSKHAEGWERQALVRARTLTEGHPRVTALVEELAFERPPADAHRLSQLRGRMQVELAGETPRRYHPKLGFGGLLDAELLTQRLQIQHANHPEVRVRHTLDAMQALHQIGAINADETETLIDAYRFFRRVQHTARLLGGRDTHLRIGGPIATVYARALGIGPLEDLSGGERLVNTWRERATELRAIFEKKVAPVPAAAPWAENS